MAGDVAADGVGGARAADGRHGTTVALSGAPVCRGNPPLSAGGSPRLRSLGDARSVVPARSTRSARVAVIGGGPAGLMAAEVLARAGARVTVFERMPSVGRKLLRGRPRRAQPHPHRAARRPARPLRPGPPDARPGDRGVRSGRPAGLVRGARAGAVRRDERPGVPVRVPGHARCCGRGCGGSTSSASSCRCATRGGVGRRMACGSPTATGIERVEPADAVVLALGGASWPRTGSDGGWVDGGRGPTASRWCRCARPTSGSRWRGRRRSPSASPARR